MCCWSGAANRRARTGGAFPAASRSGARQSATPLTGRSREETGVEIALIGLVDVVDGIRRDETGAAVSHYTLIDFAAEWVSGEAVAGDDAAEARWTPLDGLDDYRLWSETRRIIAAAAAMRDDVRGRKGDSP